MKPLHGAVWYERRRVGMLRSDPHGALHFRYESAWLEDGFPVSLRLPLELGEREINAHAFFQGLLPEGRSRRRICRQLRIDEDNDAALLFAIGEDCAGALSILPGDRVPLPPDQAAEPVDPAALHTLVVTQGRDASGIIGAAQRFSLAGAQDKLAVAIDTAGRMYTPNRDRASTHIIKFETVPHVCFAEYAALQLARRLDFLVVDCEFRRLEADEPAPYLVIRRYDRFHDAAGVVHRLHQEDTLQALGYENDVKYEDAGGPPLADVVELLRNATATPARRVQRVVDWQIFNYLIGNFDGHGKNLALLYSREQALPELAPFYDLVAIDFINRAGNAGYDRRMAFFIGGEALPETVNAAAWERFARDLGVGTRRVWRRLQEMAEVLPDSARDVRDDFGTRFGDNAVYDRFEHSIRTRCRWALQIAGERAR